MGITFAMSEPLGTHPELAPDMTNAGSPKQISKPAATLGGQSELGAAASTKAVWCDLRLASLRTNLLSRHTVGILSFCVCNFVRFVFFSLYGYGFLSGVKS